jgi:formylglycine-generating enzyme required for sulfatase activity
MTGDFHFVPGSATRPSPTTTVAALSNTSTSVPDAPPPSRPDEIRDQDKPGASPEPVKAQWVDWQNKMNAEYGKLDMFDQGDRGTPKDKIAAWDWFLKTYAADNPFSRQDDELRQQARSRFDYWRMGDHQIVSIKSAPVPTAPRPAPPPTGETFTNSLGMNFVLISAGDFVRGSPPDEFGRDPGERQHEVRISNPFYLQTTEVTQEQYQAVMGHNPSRYRDCGPNCPVDSVSWRDARQFIQRLNQMEGTNTYRLPTEAEWEYACRAGNTTSFANGQINPSGFANDPLLDRIGWYIVNAGNSPKPVAQKIANNWGLYDMHGNVWEMVQDHYAEYPSGPAVDPVGPTGGSIVIRGGNWKSLPKYCRCADRKQGNAAQGGYLTGFRLAKTR